ncbi:lecithin retinol acyltransferase family protein [Aeromonas hydrophila]|uniref:Lecithin retinol acyltransferase family protein n=1 Tax=Aeromonas salmonicida TaxID=645 RepID=A0AAX3VTJ8_AERSA|nr:MULTISPECIES: lecithin retinol acyltransferase family protein [Aeromonas]WHF36153.1 lecithin retinol acyltransferase family protein [Aeromonas salmonicida]
MPLPQPGDHLVSPRTGYQHHGLYLGDHQVIHYLGFSTGELSGQITITSLPEFCQEHDYHIQRHGTRAYDREESIDRAYSRLGEAHYSTLFNNCEHFVLWCIQGFHYSKQINQLIATGWMAHQALRTVARQPTASMVSVAATSSVLSTSTTTVAAATVGSLLSTSAVPITLSLVATYGLYRAWRWFRD